MLYFLAFLTGVIILIQTVIGAGLGEKIGIIYSAFFTFFISTVILSIFSFIISKDFNFTTLSDTPMYMYSGAFIGVFLIVSSNYIIPKLPVFISTSLIFSGQIIMGLAIDYFFGFKFSLKDFIGIALILSALIYISSLKENKKEIEENI